MTTDQKTIRLLTALNTIPTRERLLAELRAFLSVGYLVRHERVAFAESAKRFRRLD